ncbi:MAG: ParA family protein [Myxococcales bacterium]
MGRIIAVASQKGGVGKTTTVLNLGYSLSRQGLKVLLVDGDPQGGLSLASNVRRRAKGGLIEALRRKLSPTEVVTMARDNALGMVAMGAAEPDDVAFLEQASQGLSMQRLVQELAAPFDYTLVDVPGGVGALSRGLLASAESVVAAINCRALAVRSLPAFLKTFRSVAAFTDRPLRLSGLLVTMVNTRDEAQRSLLAQLRDTLPPGTLFDTVIPEDPRFEQASLRALPVAMIPGGLAAARPYVDLSTELRGREEQDATGASDDEIQLF